MPNPDDIQMSVRVIDATISALTLKASYGPAHYRECEPLIADLHQLIVKGGAAVWYVYLDPPMMARIKEGLRYLGSSWEWLRDAYRAALMEKQTEAKPS